MLKSLIGWFLEVMAPFILSMTGHDQNTAMNIRDMYSFKLASWMKCSSTASNLIRFLRGCHRLACKILSVKSQSVTNLEIHQDISVILNLQPETISFTKFHQIPPLKSQPCQTFWGIIHEPGSQLLCIGDGHPTFNRESF